MTFITSPYNKLLDLNNKEDRKLFNNACKCLEKEDRFDQKLEKLLKFLKLIGKELKNYRLNLVIE